MNVLDFGYQDNPANGLGIVRARTLIGNLRLWDIPRSEQAVDQVVAEIGEDPIPCIYMLFDERYAKKIYIGQTENLKGRLFTHIRKPEIKIKHWERAILVNDGRNATQSDLNDENIRLTLEHYLVQLFKINKYQVVTSASRSPGLSAAQKTLTETFKQELVILLTRKTKISKVFTGRKDDEIYNDDVRKILLQKKYTIESWGRLKAVVNGQMVFIRPGSKKPTGWQVTFRGSKPNSFKTKLQQGDGFLLMPRGPVLLVPLADIRAHVTYVDKQAFDRDTIDIFIRFDDDRLVLIYKGQETDITASAIREYP